jgi:hypothetical protein
LAYPANATFVCETQLKLVRAVHRSAQPNRLCSRHTSNSRASVLLAGSSRRLCSPAGRPRRSRPRQPGAADRLQRPRWSRHGDQAPFRPACLARLARHPLGRPTPRLRISPATWVSTFCHWWSGISPREPNPKASAARCARPRHSDGSTGRGSSIMSRIVANEPSVAGRLHNGQPVTRT